MLTGKEELCYMDQHNSPKLNYLKEYIKETFQYEVEEVTEFSLNGFGSVFWIGFTGKDLRNNQSRKDGFNVSFIDYANYIKKVRKT